MVTRLLLTLPLGALGLIGVGCADDAATADSWRTDVAAACADAGLDQPLETLSTRYEAAVSSSLEAGGRRVDELVSADQALARAVEESAALADAVEGAGEPDDLPEAAAAARAMRSTAESMRLAQSSMVDNGEVGGLLQNLNDALGTQRSFQAKAREAGVEGCSMLPEDMRVLIVEGDGDPLRGIMRRGMADVAGSLSPTGGPVDDAQARCLADGLTDELTFLQLVEVLEEAKNDDAEIRQATNGDVLDIWEQCVPGTLDALKQLMLEEFIAGGAPPDLARCVVEGLLDEHGTALFEMDDAELDPVFEAEIEACAAALGYVRI
jgi:hypothetical protein